MGGTCQTERGGAYTRVAFSEGFVFLTSRTRSTRANVSAHSAPARSRYSCTVEGWVVGGWMWVHMIRVDQRSLWGTRLCVPLRKYSTFRPEGPLAHAITCATMSCGRAWKLGFRALPV